MKKLLLIIVLFYLVPTAISQDIVINEFMAKNNSTVQDQDGGYSDWIELHNTSNSPISLYNYKLSDDVGNLNQWTFPEITLLPDSFLLIFASGKDILDSTELHTNFKISSTGEELFLSDNGGNLLDQTSAIQLFADQSYGRIPDGSENWMTIHTPSPGVTNNNSNELSFSHQEGFYTSPFTLKISPLVSDTIYYTLNGDVPTTQSNIFNDSLVVDFRKTDPNIFSETPTTPNQNLISYKAWEATTELIDKATTFRCVSYKNGQKTSKIYTKTFFIDEEIENKYTLPIVSLVTANKNLFDADSGIYVPGINYNSNDPEWSGNYFMKGNSWERDVHIEYFNSAGNMEFSQDAGLRIHGGKTRQAAQKSLRLYARNKYGKKYFNHKIFPQKNISNYKRLILRTSMGSWGEPTIIKDILAHDISRNLNIEYQDFQPVIVFLNGEYWGIHTLRDRIDERYIGYLYDVDHNHVEVVNNSNIAFQNLMSYIEYNDLSIDEHYTYIKSQIDIDNYIDYTIAEQFFANYDWPDNNMKLWRKLPDGKWRWIFYDLDAGFGDADYNMLNHTTKNDSTITWPNSPSATFLFRNLLKNEKFKNQYIQRYAEILNNDFNIHLMQEKYETLVDLYQPEINDHSIRWNYPKSETVWKSAVAKELLTFIEQRPCQVLRNITDFFDLSDFEFHCFKDANIDNMESEIVLAPNPNDGQFFLFNNHDDMDYTKIRVTNTQGKNVYSTNLTEFKKGKVKHFNLSHLPNSTYVLKVASAYYTQQLKIIIIK